MGLQRRPRRDQEPAASSLVIRNVVVGGHRTSVRLEPIMWEALRDIALRRSVTIHDLVTEIDDLRRSSQTNSGSRPIQCFATEIVIFRYRIPP